MQEDPHQDVWTARQRRNTAVRKNSSSVGAKLCAKKGIDAYLSENDLPLGEKGGGLEGSQKELSSKLQKSARNSNMDLELQEVKSTIIESRSLISGQALIDAQKSANGDSYSLEDHR